MLRVSTYVHQFLLNHLSKDAVILDLTCGRGSDTLFCAQHFKHVYAVDIQVEAIELTQQKCQLLNNVSFILDDHQNIDHHLHQPIDACLFNSGFLPKSSSSIITSYHSSQIAIQKAIQLMKPEAYLCLVLYLKHDQGVEANQLKHHFSHHKDLVLMSHYHYSNDALSPQVLIFQKSNKSS
jgi:methylase of polypeptide subunit release factors